jgi:hypothetical protein
LVGAVVMVVAVAVRDGTMRVILVALVAGDGAATGAGAVLVLVLVLA